jgi:hypothetical protein
MKYIITEEQRDRLAVRRRLPELKELLTNLYPWQYPCDYNTLDYFLLSMGVEMFEVTTLDWFENVNHEVIWGMVNELYMDDMVNHYISNCVKK